MAEENESGAEHRSGSRSPHREESIVYHLVAIEGFQREAQNRVRKVMAEKNLSRSEMKECREIVAEVQKVFTWFNNHVTYHRIALMKLIPDTERKRKAIAKREEHNRSLRYVHWTPHRSPFQRPDSSPTSRSEKAEKRGR
jgi:hypothetical protein